MIVEGSIVWLYCQVNSSSTIPTVTWTRDSSPLVPDTPHIRMRNSTSSNSSTTLYMLIVDNFQTSDSGMYQCIVQDMSVMGTAVTLTGTVALK